MNGSLKGKRCVGFARSATDNVESLAAQVKAINAFAMSHQMVLRDQISLLGVGGNRPESYIERLVERKAKKNDFDILLVTTWDRLGRLGAFGAMKLLGKLIDAGIRVIAVSDGPEGSNLESVMLFVPSSPDTDVGEHKVISHGKKEETNNPPDGTPHDS